MAGWLDNFWEFMKGDKGGMIGKSLGTVGDGLGFASTVTEGKTSEYLTMASGSSTGLSGVAGMLSSVGEMKKGDTGKGVGDFFESFLNSTVGAADITTGVMGYKAIMNPGEAEKYTRRKGIAQIVSGAAGGLSGLISAGRGIADWIKYRKGGKEAGKDAAAAVAAAEKRREARLKLLGGIGKIFNGVGTAVQGGYMTAKPSEEPPKMWSTWRKLSSGFGMLPGVIDTYSAGKKVVDASNDEPAEEVPKAQQKDSEKGESDDDPFVISD